MPIGGETLEMSGNLTAIRVISGTWPQKSGGNVLWGKAVLLFYIWFYASVYLRNSWIRATALDMTW